MQQLVPPASRNVGRLIDRPAAVSIPVGIRHCFNTLGRSIVAARLRRPLREVAGKSVDANWRRRQTWRDGWCYHFGMIVFDEIAKILAAPMGRRNALKLAGKVLTGGVLANLVLGQTYDATCKKGTSRCHGQGFEKCIHGKWVFFKCPPGTTCRPSGSSIECLPGM
jgi:carbohydrate binding protein with CBM19 domain